MLLLVKDATAGNIKGIGVHIPGTDGRPICHARLNPNTWHIIERDPTHEVMCGSCRRLRALKERSL